MAVLFCPCSISLKTFRPDTLFEASDRRALIEKQRQLEEETSFLVQVNEYLNLLAKKRHMEKVTVLKSVI
jgi:hypothetical protein